MFWKIACIGSTTKSFTISNFSGGMPEEKTALESLKRSIIDYVLDCDAIVDSITDTVRNAVRNPVALASQLLNVQNLLSNGAGMSSSATSR